MQDKTRYDWNWFLRALHLSSRKSTRALRDSLSYVQLLDQIAQKALDRQTSPISDHPEEFVAVVMLARCFRLMTAGIYLLLSGYPDTSINLDRTTWEIGVRLSYILETDPRGGALGLLLDAYKRELKMIEAEQQFRIDNKQDLLNLPLSITSLKETIDKLNARASSMGYSPEDLVGKYARIGVGTICERLGIRKAYDVSFAFLSGYVHERFATLQDMTKIVGDKAMFNLGPQHLSKIEQRAQIFDTIQNAALATRAAVTILNEQDLIKATDRLLHRLSNEDIFK